MVSTALKQDLIAWNDEVLAAYHLSGAEAQRAEVRLFAYRRTLVARAQDELGPGYDVQWFA